MSLVTVYCSTVYEKDYSANTDKFYRVYAAGRWSVFQWGRTGTVGQFKGEGHVTDGPATAACRDQLEKKRAKGYTGLEERTFQFDVDLLDGSKQRFVQLDDVRQASTRSAPRIAVGTSTTPPSANPAPPAPRDPYAEFTDRALKAISLAVTDPQKGAVEYALLNAQWPELEQLHAKAQSYLKTLDSLVMGVTA